MRERAGEEEREREGGRGREGGREGEEEREREEERLERGGGRERKREREEERLEREKSMSSTLEKCTRWFDNFARIFWPYLQLHGERNYHVFYRLLAGMPANKLAKLHLTKDPWGYSYLTKVSIVCKAYYAWK